MPASFGSYTSFVVTKETKMKRSNIIKGFIEIEDPTFRFSIQYLLKENVDLMEDEPIEIRRYLEKQASQGILEAQFVLSKLLLLGLVGDRNQEQAFKWCKRAYDSGYMPAIESMAQFYLGGFYVDKDIGRGIKLLTEASNKGSAYATSFLSMAYLHGISIVKDENKGEMLEKKAAEMGDANSQYSVAMKILDSGDVSLFEKGMQWLQTAAKNGLPRAHRELARVYSKGSYGMPKDKDKSIFHRRKADDIETKHYPWHM